MLDIQLKPVESLLFRGDVVAVGSFRCPATHPLFRDSGPCSHHTFVFPRTVTRIRHEEGAAFVGNPAGVAFYNQHQRYTRTRVSELDASDWYTVAEDVLLDVLGPHDASVTPERPFRFADAPSDAKSFLEQRRLFEALSKGIALDALHVEETVLRVLGRLVARTYAKKLPAPRPSDIEAVERAKELIATDPAANLPLRELSRATRLSPFHLCRLFRLRTGETMTRYRHTLRLRMALPRLGEDLSQLAQELGYASHSHFTAMFRRHFGVTPSAWRAMG
ncbi:MAG TPA: AraC family transcriptional regulator [Thermoanaerobaculia bacterium]